MKRRNGLVSNSSSSSFLIYGTEITEEESETLTEADGVEIIYGQPDYGGKYLGTSWSDVRDDETGAQFKARVKAAVEKILSREVSCGTFSEAWYAG